MNLLIYIGNILVEVKSLVIIVDDFDVLVGIFIYWIVWNILFVGEIFLWVFRKFEIDELFYIVQGKNDFGRIGYNGFCLLRGYGVYYYYFKVYVFDMEFKFEFGFLRKELEKVMEGYVIVWGEVVGFYERK